MTYAKNHDTHDVYIDDVPNEAGKDQITRKKQQLSNFKVEARSNGTHSVLPYEEVWGLQSYALQKLNFRPRHSSRPLP